MRRHLAGSESWSRVMAATLVFTFAHRAFRVEFYHESVEFLFLQTSRVSLNGLDAK